MAKILRHGTTPLWGVYDGDGVKGVNSGVILDSYNYSVDVKDYELLDEKGSVVGYLVYDLSVNFDMSGTLIFKGSNESESSRNSGYEVMGSFNCNHGIGARMMDIAIHQGIDIGINTKLSTPKHAIIKSISVNTAQGSAATFTASGSIYALEESCATAIAE